MIRGGIHQFIDTGHVLDAHFENPAFAIRIGIDESRIGFHLWIAFDDLSRDRRVNIARGFHRFHNRGRVTHVHLATEDGELDEHHIGQLGLRVIGNAYRGYIAFEAKPFMRLIVSEIAWDIHV